VGPGFSCGARGGGPQPHTQDQNEKVFTVSEKFRLTRAQAKGLADVIRKSSWVSEIGGDHTLTVSHRDGIEITITVNSPPPVDVKVIRGFKP
jgi:hypothetical protein